MRPILEVEDVVKRFGGIRAVDGASLDVEPGSITALIGPNGAGKTTLFNVMTGFYRGEHGSITFSKEQIFGRPPYAIARLGMVRTFQITKALARMPVIDNMMLAAPDQPGEKLRNVVFRPRACARREAEVRKQAMELLELFNLHQLADEYAATLSGGQRKLLELARALMTGPRMLLLDEPMAGINPTLGRRLLEHIQRLREERDVTFLFIEHDMEVVMGHSDRVIVMAEGRVIADGSPEEVRTDQRVIDAYLGSKRVILSTEGLVAGYVPEVDILNGVSIAVDEGEIVTVIGPNGAGKSTLIKTIFGLLKPRSGRVLLRDEDVSGAKPHTITRKGLSYVPQLDNVFPSLTVEENLEMGSLDRSLTGERIARMHELFPRLGERRSQSRRHHERRRAADGRDGAGAHAGPSGPAARRAVGRARADVRRRDLREGRRDQPLGRHDRDGRAECAAGARTVRSRLRARPRQGPLRRRRQGARSTTRRSRSFTWAAQARLETRKRGLEAAGHATGLPRPSTRCPLLLAGRAFSCCRCLLGRHLLDLPELAVLQLDDVVDTLGWVAVVVQVDLTGGAVVVDVLSVLKRLDRIRQLLPGVLVPGRSGDALQLVLHRLALRGAGRNRSQIAEDDGVEVLAVERSALDVLGR